MRQLFLSVTLVLAGFASAVHAQERSPLVIPERESIEVMLLRTSASSRCQQDCFVRAAPYAGQKLIERVQVLADGNRIVQRYREQLYRDAEGRSRVESEWQGRPLVQIQDPVGNMSYRLYPADKTGLSMAIGTPAPPANPSPTALVPAGEGAARLAERLAPAMASTAVAAETQRSARSLGTRQMEGLTVEGKLETSTLPAGAAGNALPIVSTTETWYAPELKLVLYVRSVDPRTGEQVTRVQNLRRGEPPASLFAVPAGYKVQQIARR